MKTTQQLIGLALATLISTASGFAQTTTTTTPPTGTPAGSASTGTTNSGSVAPVKGTTPPTTTKPTTTTGSGASVPVTGKPSDTPGGPGNANPHTPNEHASDTAKAVQAVLKQFEVKRDQAIADRKALLDKLQAAKTETERQAIITQLRTETQAEKDEQKMLGKQIRDELKTLRDQRKSGG